jgi:hypothetical protein
MTDRTPPPRRYATPTFPPHPATVAFGPVPQPADVRRICRALADQLPDRPGPVAQRPSAELAETTIAATWARTNDGAGWVPMFMAFRGGALLLEARGARRFADEYSHALRAARRRQQPTQQPTRGTE